MVNLAPIVVRARWSRTCVLPAIGRSRTFSDFLIDDVTDGPSRRRTRLWICCARGRPASSHRRCDRRSSRHRRKRADGEAVSSYSHRADLRFRTAGRSRRTRRMVDVTGSPGAVLRSLGRRPDVGERRRSFGPTTVRQDPRATHLTSRRAEGIRTTVPFSREVANRRPVQRENAASTRTRTCRTQAVPQAETFATSDEEASLSARPDEPGPREAKNWSDRNGSSGSAPTPQARVFLAGRAIDHIGRRFRSRGAYPAS